MARTPYRDAFAATDNDRPSTSGSDKKELWSSLLDNVASGKKIPEKKLIVLGGTSDTQKDFLDSLQQDSPTRPRPPDRQRLRKIPIANRFALGYTYQHVYDEDHDDIVARLSTYTLTTPSAAYAPLLAPLLTPQAIPNTAVVILLDWAKPWTFVRSLRSWIRLLNTVARDLPVESKYALDENTTAWQHARDAALATSMTDTHTNMPLGPGEYDDPLGLPLVVVCQNALAVETLEKERGYKEYHFDYVLQFLRTVLLKHGAGLIYTMPSQPGQLQPLIHSVLAIQSAAIAVTGKEKSERTLKHNVVDRERVLVPPAWDSWGKIRVLREGFDVEGISRAWAVEIQHLPSSRPARIQLSKPAANRTEEGGPGSDAVAGATEDQGEEGEAGGPEADDQDDDQDNQDDQDTDSTAFLYEQTIQDPHPPDTKKPTIDVQCTPDQHFFASQLDRLESYRAEDEAAKKATIARRAASGSVSAGVLTGAGSAEDGAMAGRAMAEHIGPVQFNMGGIQYNVEDALKRLNERTKAPTESSTPTRARRATNAASRDGTPFTPISPPQTSAGDSKDIPTENLEAYFASLMKKGQRGVNGSPGMTSNSPRPGKETN